MVNLCIALSLNSKYVKGVFTMRYHEFRQLSEEEISYISDIKYNLFSSDMLRGRVGEAVKNQMDKELKRRFHFNSDVAEIDSDQYLEFEKEVKSIITYMYKLHQYGYDRRHDLSEWFQLDKLNYQQLLQRTKQSIKPIEYSNDDDEEEDEIEVSETSRFVPYLEDMENWHYIRFGRIPTQGGSHFGLAGDDNEDGPDEWRKETGGMTREAGVSVFRAARSHNDPQGWEIFMPDFDRARYQVSDEISYMKSILPAASIAKWRKNPDTPLALLLHGSPVTIKMQRSKTPFIELGSDGEYLIDTKKPLRVTNVGIDHIYISRDQKLLDLYPDISDDENEDKY